MFIEVRDIKKDYVLAGSVVPVLKGISLSIDTGEFVAVMGPSGSGKSTFCNVLACLMTPTSGSYLFSGKEIARMASEGLSQIRNRNLGFVFQDYILLEGLTAMENVMLPLLYDFKIGMHEASRRAEEALSKVGMREKKGNLPKQLSGGQKQRVAIARALITQPSVLIADEPCGALDPISRRDVLKILQSLNESGVTIIMITHSQEDADHAKRIIVLEDGKLVQDNVVQRRLIAGSVSEGEQTSTNLKLVRNLSGIRQAEDVTKLLELVPTLEGEAYIEGLQLLASFLLECPSGEPYDLGLQALESAEPRVKMLALEILDQVYPNVEVPKQDQIEDRLLDLLDHPSDEIRHRTIVMCFKYLKNFNEQAIAKLLKVPAKEPDARVRANIARGFSRLSLEDCQTPIIYLLNDEDDRVRANALETLVTLWGHHGGEMPKLSEKLKQFWEDRSWRVRAAMAVLFYECERERAFGTINALLNSSEPLAVASGIYSSGKVAPDIMKARFNSLMENPSKAVQNALRRWAEEARSN